MQIIKHGKSKGRHFRCTFCDCEFIAKAGEYEYANEYIKVRCPECMFFVIAEHEQAPLED